MKTSLENNLVVEYDDAGAGAALVLLHAFPLARAQWRPQVEALQADYRVIAPDLRGFGGTSPFGAAPSVEVMADDVAALLDALRVDGPVVLGGLSMGGYVALAFARRHAGRLRGLLLADTKAEPDTAEAKANRDKTIDFARSHTSADVARQMLPKLLGGRTQAERPEAADEVLRIASAQTTSAVIDALGALRDRPDAVPGLGHIRVPTLVIVGAEDALTPPDVAKALASAIPHARLTVLDGAGHLSNLERPEEFNEAAREFLRALV